MAFDREIAAITCFCEASGQPREARAGVLWSMFNRLVTLRYGRSVAEICLRRAQYSEWNGDQVNNQNLLRAAKTPDTDPVLLDCLELYEEVRSGEFFDPTGGATHYHDTSVNVPPWAKTAERTCQLGKLIFYKGVK